MKTLLALKGNEVWNAFEIKFWNQNAPVSHNLRDEQIVPYHQPILLIIRWWHYSSYCLQWFFGVTLPPYHRMRIPFSEAVLKSILILVLLIIICFLFCVKGQVFSATNSIFLSLFSEISYHLFSLSQRTGRFLIAGSFFPRVVWVCLL